MKETDLDALRGQTSALSSVLTAIIQTLPPLNAAQAALHLKTSNLDAQSLDDSEGTPPVEAQIRDAVVEAYLGLLSTAAQRV